MIAAVTCQCAAHKIGPGPVVINRHHHRASGSRLPRPIPEPWIYIGRSRLRGVMAPLGNPYTVAEHGVEAALQSYRRYLWSKIKERDQDVMAVLSTITDAHHLVCSCAPRPCHGDVVVAAVKWCREEKIIAHTR